jgi:hypothetical protein
MVSQANGKAAPVLLWLSTLLMLAFNAARGVRQILEQIHA